MTYKNKLSLSCEVQFRYMSWRKRNTETSESVCSESNYIYIGILAGIILMIFTKYKNDECNTNSVYVNIKILHFIFLITYRML